MNMELVTWIFITGVGFICIFTFLIWMFTLADDWRNGREHKRVLERERCYKENRR